jgi:ankyrin repeat protein
VKRAVLAVALAALLGAAPAPLLAQQRSADTSASALHWAAYRNDLDAVKRLLAEGADPNAVNRFGVTPLHEAATVGNAEILNALLEAGGDANAAFGEGETALMTAARTGDVESVRLLLEHGADVDASELWHGQTALMWAAIENHADVVQLLIEAGAEVQRVSTKHDWVKISYSEGNVPKTRDLGGLTALQFAAREGSLESVEKLLDAGADANAAEPMYQLTPLQLAIVNGHYTLATRLIERGADPDLPYTKGLPEGLLPEGAAKPRLPERTVAGEIVVPPGATPLDRAAAASDFAVVETLLTHGASAKVVTEDGTTPLMLLAGYSRTRTNAPLTDIPKRLELIRLMLEKGADVHAVHRDSTNNALFFAKQRNAPEIVALLEQHGAREATAANAN